MIRRALRLLFAALFGYVVIALLQTLFLELLLGGRVAPEAALSVQLAGIIGTVVSGILGGYIAARIGGERPLLHAAVVLIPLLGDTIFVISRNSGEEPLWFLLAGSMTLMVATIVGGWVRARTGERVPPTRS